MKTLIKIHFYYVMNKKIITAIIGLKILVCLTFMMHVQMISDNLDVQDWIKMYYTLSSIMMQMILGFLSVLLFALSVDVKQDFYAYFVLTSQISRKLYFVSKIFLNLAMSSCIGLFSIFVFCVIGFIHHPLFFINSSMVIGFISIICIIMVYGLYSMLLMQFFKHIFIILLPIVLLIIANNMRDGISISVVEKTCLFFFPTLLETHQGSYFGVVHLLWLIVSGILINSLVFCHRDLNY